MKMARLIKSLTAALDRSDVLLEGARRSGMEVSEALLRQSEGRESLVKAKVAVHAFQVGAVGTPVTEGLVIAGETYQAGETALKERRFRRIGLAFSLLAILATIIGLGLAIRMIEGRPEEAAQ